MLKIGNFSKIAGVSVRLLHYYEELGLFDPAYIDPTSGYRYYKSEQITDLNKIIALKDLGFTLQEIKLYIDEKISRDELKGMLKLKKSQVYQSIEDELLQLKRIEYRLQQLDEAEVPHLSDVIIKPIAAQRYLSFRNPAVPIRNFGTFLNQLINALSGQNMPFPGPLTVLEHNSTFPDDNFDLEMGFILPDDKQLSTSALVLNKSLALTVRELPEVPQMATYLHVGPWGTGMRAYMGLGKWMETHNFELAGVIREVFYEISSEDKENNVIEFQLPIKSTQRILL